MHCQGNGIAVAWVMSAQPCTTLCLDLHLALCPTSDSATTAIAGIAWD